MRTLHDEKHVAADVAALVRDEKSRERFEARLKQYGFDIQSSADKSDCEAQLCLDDHCRLIFVLTYKVDSTEKVHGAETAVFGFRSMKQ